MTQYRICLLGLWHVERLSENGAWVFVEQFWTRAAAQRYVADREQAEEHTA